ncbi:MAG: hypothetical protein PHR25_04415 [Clostridia bacterium]|nr:hypothetical protein [Clostridia bacterium]MDD4376007.1 hypothetical protein [Clostridia bacterium]
MNKKKISKKSNNKKANKVQKVRFWNDIFNYTFLISLVLTIIFAFQTNSVFWIPFLTVLAITIISMILILLLALIRTIKKRIGNQKKISA